MTTKQKATLAIQLAAEELKLRAIYVTTYPPRECGIATYTKDLTSAINILNPYCLADIVAIDDFATSNIERTYPWEVKYKIEQQLLSSWLKAAEYINQSGAEVVNLQHEFGIYGGPDGEFVVPFMEAIKKPIVVCFHTVLPQPSASIKRIVQQVAELSAAIIVIVDAGGQKLVDEYGIDPAKVVTIPHGVPDIPFGGTNTFKNKLGYKDWNIVSSFGLFSRSKGYEHAIEAMPEIIKKHPKTKLLLLGQTHPVVLRNEGEIYRDSLKKLITELGVEDNVEFVDRYLTIIEIVEYLRASDVYITPYPNMEQVSSGTLSYAISAGLACISTPYVYAKEVLSEGRGVLMNKDDSRDLSAKVIQLLDDPKARHAIAKKAYAYGRNMIWPRVGLAHLDLFEIVKEK